MILRHIPIDNKGRQTLVACASVATWWTGPSQRRLFSSVMIHYRNYQRWINGVASPRSKSQPLKYVRSLQHYCLTPVTETSYWMRNLHNLRSLGLSYIEIGHINKAEYHPCFSAFRETLTNLTLEDFDTSFSAFVTLVDYFPNITTLQLGSFEVKSDEGVVPPLSRPLRGKLCLHANRVGFFDQLAGLDPEYEELVLGSRFSTGEKFVGLPQLCANTVKYLRLTVGFKREHPYETSSSLHILTQFLTFQPEQQRRSATFDNCESWK